MQSNLSKLQSLSQPVGAVELFRGLFDQIGVRVTDAGEQFTCRHLGDRVVFEEGMDPAAVDYVVEIQSGQVDRLAGQVIAGRLDQAEQYRIVSALFTPGTAAMLKNPVLSQPSLRKLAGVEDLIHVKLRSPVQEEPAVAHTLVYANRQWLVLPGLHGDPARVYDLSVEQALDYHRRAFAALKANNLGAWTGFAAWYREWRRAVTISGAPAPAPSILATT